MKQIKDNDYQAITIWLEKASVIVARNSTTRRDDVMAKCMRTMAVKMRGNDKGSPIFGLDKVPEEAIIKQLRTELGKANSYIQELEESLTKMKECKKNSVKCFKATEIGQAYTNKIVRLEAKIKLLNKDKEQLIHDLIELRKSI